MECDATQFDVLIAVVVGIFAGVFSCFLAQR